MPIKFSTLLPSNVQCDFLCTGITQYSNKVLPGFIFVAVKGISNDGHYFIDEAIKRGAKAIIVDNDFVHSKNSNILYIKSSNTKNTLCHLSEAFYDFPSKTLKVVGITGTNGKTSSTFMLHSIFKKAGFRPAIIGTLGYGQPDDLTPSNHTTMEPEFLSESLAKLLSLGITHVFMEVSSHALMLNRVDAINFHAVSLTNITPEHLDFHKTLENYQKAKAKLFFSLAKKDSFRFLPSNHPFENIDACLWDLLPKVKFTLPFYGSFHEKNAHLSAVMAEKLGISKEDIIYGLENCPRIPCRLEEIKNGPNKPRVFVDFAHTPDALETVLRDLARLEHNKLMVVFGCGGERDKEKRPNMGLIAERYSSEIYITDDNPRSEDPKIIRDEILSGISRKFKVNNIADREEAITRAINNSSPNDIVLIAGKGHERYQDYNGIKKEFSDYEIINKVLSSWL